MLGGISRGKPRVATITAGRHKSVLLYVLLYFLVNTSAELSIIPSSKAERNKRQNTFGLLATNNSPMQSSAEAVPLIVRPQNEAKMNVAIKGLKRVAL